MTDLYLFIFFNDQISKDYFFINMQYLLNKNCIFNLKKIRFISLTIKNITMKTLLKLACLLLMLTACEGDQGPPGPPGFDGVNFVGQSFERTIDFTSANNYEEYIQIPLTIELLPTDMILTYILWEQDPVTGNDVWRLLPQIVYTDSGEEFQYNYDYGFDEVRLFIDAPVTFNFNNLPSAATQNQTFRFVILPVDFVNSTNLDVTNFDNVMQYVQ